MRLPRGQRVAWLLGTVSLLLIGLGIVWVGILPGGIGRKKPSHNAPLPRLQLATLKPTDRRPAVPHVPPMPTADREYLWQVEHHGNILNQLGFADLSKALSRADEPALRKIFADIFHGRVPEHTKDVSLETPFAQVVRRRSDGPAGVELDRSGFIGRLLEFRRLFTRTPRVKLSLMALAPVAREDMNGLWKGGCLLRMFDGGGAEGPREVILHMHYQVARPEEATIAKGSWIHSAEIIQSQVAHSPRPLLREVAVESGIVTSGLHDNWNDDKTNPVSGGIQAVTGGVYLGDYDRDGRVDMLVTDTYYHALYRGLADGKFVDVTRKTGLKPNSGSVNSILMGQLRNCALADFDGDGWEDVILGPLVYRNEEGKGFSNVTPKSNFGLPFQAAGAVLADYDRDGLIDAYIPVAGGAKTESWLNGHGGSVTNHLFRNRGNWQFEDVTEATGTGGGNRSSFTAAWLDANNDGWPDLYVPNEFGDGILLVNQEGKRFVGQPLVDQPSDFGTMGVAVGDVDNDDRIDIYAANMYSKAGSRVIGNLRPGTYPEDVMAIMRTYPTGSQLHRNLGGLKFEKKATEWQIADVGWAYGSAFVDLDNDGWLDIYATCGFISQDRSKPDG